MEDIIKFELEVRLLDVFFVVGGSLRIEVRWDVFFVVGGSLRIEVRWDVFFVGGGVVLGVVDEGTWGGSKSGRKLKL